MKHLDETPRIIGALQHIDAADRDIWVRVGMAIRAECGEAGFPIWDAWSRTAPNYQERDAHDVWRSFGDSGPVGLGSLFHLAQEGGWSDSAPRRELSSEEVEARRRSREEADAKDRAERQRVQAQAARWAAELLAGAPEADGHDYLHHKGLRPVPTLRTVHAARVRKLTGWTPKGKAGALQGDLLAARCVRPGSGVAVALELIDADGRKAGLPGRGTRAGAFWSTSLPLPKPAEASTILLGEGVATVLSGTQATGIFGVASLSSSNLINVAQGLRQQYPDTKIIILADLDKQTGKPDPHSIEAARTVGGYLAVPDFGPGRKPESKDFNDLLVLRGAKAVKVCVERATQVEQEQVEQAAPRFNVLRRDDLMNLPDIEWIIIGVMPSRGVGAVHGPSTAGKSFLLVDMAAHIAEGREWFGHRSQQRPIAYACLEGQHGFRRRIQAWEEYHGRRYPEGVVFLPDPLDLRSQKDTGALCEVIQRELGPGCVVIIDTLNRAAPGMEENSSVDYGLILASAGRIEQAVQGFVCFVGHPGKDTSKGFRGHSSMFAALDMNIELLPVPGVEGLSSWVLRKAKDGRDGITKHFRREVVELGQDLDGDMVTSCVIVPDPESDAIQASSSRAMTQKDGERFESYRQAAMDHGILDDAGNFIGLDPEDWRAHFYARSAAPTTGAKRSAFYKAKNGLTRAGWLNETLGGLLLPEGPGAEVHVETIGAAIRERTGRTEAYQERTGTPAAKAYRVPYRTRPFRGGTLGTPGTGSENAVQILDEEV